jgi:hypothetical protein
VHVTRPTPPPQLLCARRRIGHWLVLFAALALSGGCAERGIISRPDTPPSALAWAAVWLAGVLAALIIGVLLTLPAWRARGGARLAVTFLTLQTGAVAVTGTVLAAVSVRSWQLIGRSPDAHPAVALVRLSGVDGDTAFFAIMTVAAAVLTVLLVTLTSMATQLAAGSDPLERSVASALLAIELGGSGYAIVRLALGAHGLPYLTSALAFPLLVVAFATCWPRQAPV